MPDEDEKLYTKEDMRKAFEDSKKIENWICSWNEPHPDLPTEFEDWLEQEFKELPHGA